MTEPPKTAAELLAGARSKIERLEPSDLAADPERIVVDIRDSADRATEGAIPGSMWIPRTVLEWRADSTSEQPDPRIADPALPLVVVCNDGYSSSLAAATLRDMGFSRAADLIGGFRAWKAAGLPVDQP
jgi:rhodanese-related sulfurtransferase